MSYFCRILLELEFYQQLIVYNTSIRFYGNRQAAAELFRAGGPRQTDRQTDMTCFKVRQRR